MLHRYRSLTPKARIIHLPGAFIDYLRADGIVLPPDEQEASIFSPSPEADTLHQTPNGEESDDEEFDPSQPWSGTHAAIRAAITELGGSVMPKLNWSAPKDATWISATNSMDCRSANDVYLLLKSSDFVTHDLEQAFDGCVDKDNRLRQSPQENIQVPYHLVLRKTVPAFNPSMEFRCFVRDRTLLCACQRDMNHFDFLPRLVPQLRRLLQKFFTTHLAMTFPDPNFTFDVYVPNPHNRVWLIDINPWAPRTDPLLFSWLEILEMVVQERFDRGEQHFMENKASKVQSESKISDDTDSGTNSEENSGDNEYDSLPEIRLINRDDPEAYSFNTPQYSAHKLPKDVVDASSDGEAGLREFMSRWKEVVDRQEREDNAE